MESKHVLLIAEDESEICEHLSEVLAPIGLPILIASDGKEMLNQLQLNPQIVAVLSDIHMPKMTGLEVLKCVREKGVEIPFVFLTAYGQKEYVIEALRQGALDFLEKPYGTEVLLKVMSQAAEIGIGICNVDIQLKALAKKYKIANEDMEQFVAVQKPLLVEKIKNRVLFKRETSG